MLVTVVVNVEYYGRLFCSWENEVFCNILLFPNTTANSSSQLVRY